MMLASPIEQELVADAARAHRAAPHGQKAAVVERLAADLGLSIASAQARLRTALQRGRKRRSDAGSGTLSRKEAVLIAATIEESRRRTGTGALTLGDAVALLRANGHITAGTIDETTGEWSELSMSAISRSLRAHTCHPEQLAAATPATRLRSPHPNHCWQIDASVSRQFYLAEGGTEQMDQVKFYRGKPGNFVKIASNRLWRYAITDHCAGAIEAFYVAGAESAANMLAALMHAMSKRTRGTMHGLPKYLMADPGSAVTSAVTRNFCKALGIELIVNEVGNARAKGQVEQANYLIERHFEAALKLRAPVTSLAEINELCARWAQSYNGTAIHTRTGVTRRDGWLRITREQLRFAPSIDVLRQLANSTPKPCTVRDYLIRFKGARYDLTGLEGVLNGQRVHVMINPFDEGTVRVLTTGADGREAHYLAPRRDVDEWGSDIAAAIVGEQYVGVPETPVDAVRKEIGRLQMEVATDVEAAAARKEKRIAFGGKLDPTAHWLVPNEALPRAGTPSDINATPEARPVAVLPADRPRFESPRLSLLDTMRELVRRVESRGHVWTPQHYARAAERWPEGLPDEQLDAAALQLIAPTLRAVGGAA